MVGLLLSKGPWQQFGGFRDLQAWVAILAMLALSVEIIILAFINPQLSANEQLLSPGQQIRPWDYALTGVIGAYFGIRS